MDLNEILQLDRHTLFKYLHVLGQEIDDSSSNDDMEYLQSLLLSCFPYQEDRKDGNLHIESEAPININGFLSD